MKAIPFSFTKNSDPQRQTMFGVTMLHVAALVMLLNPFTTAAEQPVLSFTVTMMELSSLQNTVSSSASSASAPAEQATPQKATQEVKDTPAAQPKKIVKAVTAPAKTRSVQSHNAQAQTAVLAPTMPAQFDAAYLNNPKPAYPSLSRRLGEQGNVLLSAYVTEDGHAEAIRLKQSSGFARLDNAALEAVQRWRFAAARQGEKLVASWVQVPVKFVLE